MRKAALFLIVVLAVCGMAVLIVEITKSATNISASNRYAWSDVSGWWDFYYYNNVTVGTSTLIGYASSSIGEISLDCATSPGGDICGTSNYKVTNPSGSGQLSGCAWNDAISWISFWCGDGDCDGGNTEDASSTCASSNYRITVDANGIFHGYAWNDIEGWISFNCANDTGCGSSDYKLETSWRGGKLTGTLDSSIFDTQALGGATLNSIIWQGTQPAGTCTKFQIAVSTSDSGPWNFWGPDASCDGSGDTNQYFGSSCPGPDSTIEISGCNRNWVKDKRYLRYRVILESDTAQSLTPQVNDVILNWSR